MSDEVKAEQINQPRDYEGEAYVEGVRDLASMIERDQTANWKAVAGVLRDCAGLIEHYARQHLQEQSR